MNNKKEYIVRVWDTVANKWHLVGWNMMRNNWWIINDDAGVAIFPTWHKANKIAKLMEFQGRNTTKRFLVQNKKWYDMEGK